MNRFILAAAATLVSIATAQEDYDDWAHYKDITINTTASGADVANDVTRFPLLVRLTPEDGGDVVHFSEGRGADIRFTKADGETRLPHQIDHWDSAQQVADIWVLVDTVFGDNDDQSVRVYWGNADADDSSSGSAVFDTADGYVSVWHLGDAARAEPRPNAIEGRFSATPTNFAPGYFTKPGIAGRSDSLTGGQNFELTSYLAINEGAESDLYNFPDGRFTYTVWAHPADAENFVRLISLVGTDPGDDRIFLSFNNGNIIARTWGTASHPTNSSVPPDLNEWNHFAMTVNRGEGEDTTRVFHNGEEIASSTHDPMNDVQRNYVRIGRDEINPNDFTFNGRVDESRISNVARGADYMKLSFETQRPGSAVLTQGDATPATGTVPDPAPAPVPPAGLDYTVTTAVYLVDSAVTPNVATVTGDVDTFYVVPPLPEGLALNPANGEITGTPVAPAFQSNYTVVAENEGGSSVRVLTITVETPPTSLRPGSRALRVSGTPRNYTFTIAPELASVTESLTLSISDIWGRTVWSKTVDPSRDGQRELAWNGKLSNGRRAAAGMYILQAKAVSGGKPVNALERMVSLKPE